MIICAFNLRFITQTSYLRLYHFFQINSFLMSFYSFIKFLRYYCSSFIPARIFSLIELRLLHNLVIFMGRTGVMLVLFYIQQIFFLTSSPANRWCYRVYLELSTICNPQYFYIQYFYE